LIAPATPAFVNAQTQTDWPAKPARIVVPFAAGGTADIIARILAQNLTKAFGQPFVADNRPGASGNIGAAECSLLQNLRKWLLWTIPPTPGERISTRRAAMKKPVFR
jgi:tripartite-type tricarboxylate transporter receptor subunit TctC